MIENDSMSVAEAVFKTKNQLVTGDRNGYNPLVGNGNTFLMDPNLKEAVERDAKVAFNNKVEEETEAWNQRIAEQEQHAKEMEEKMRDLEIVPINSYVMVQPYKKNPFQKLEVTKTGIILPEYMGTFKNPDSGEEDQEENLSVQALVIEVSPLCKFVREGDVVYYRRACGVPIPFFSQGLEVVAEQQIHAVVNSGLKKRFSKIIG